MVDKYINEASKKIDGCDRIHIDMNKYIYIYIYREREREI